MTPSISRQRFNTNTLITSSSPLNQLHTRITTIDRYFVLGYHGRDYRCERTYYLRSCAIKRANTNNYDCLIFNGNDNLTMT